MSNDNRYDIIIIGTGAGGGTLAHHLAPSGQRILILERGDYVPREKANWYPKVVNVDAHYNTKETWLDKNGKELHPHTNYYVGGNTKFYGAALFRLRERDFGTLHHHGGVSPAWPISYSDLEPYYTQAEQLYCVHGNRGEDPTEPPASSNYPWPAVSHESRIQELSDSFAAQGLKPFHVPVGVMLDENNPQKSRCIRCNTCDGFPCLMYAKSDAQVLCVDEAVKYPQCHLADEFTGEAAEDQSFRPRSDRRCGGAQRRRRARVRRYRCGLVRSNQLGGSAVTFGERQAPKRPGQQL